MKNIPINSDKKFKYSITFSNWDNESLEIGETDDKGFEYQDEIDAIGEILYLANDQYGIDTPTSFGSWESSQPKEDADFYEKGINKYYTLHIHNLDGSDISQEENDFISFLLSDGRLEINKFREYAVGGLLQGISHEDYFLVVQNWVYFTYNYPRTFLEEMSEFHKEKFSILYEKNGSRSVVPAFWKSISDDAKYKMAIWIKNNYYNRKSEKEKLETISDEHYFDILNHWNHFSQNPPMNFVEDVFESMSEHFEEKWITAYKNVGAIGSMNKFFTELSEGYQKLLTDWVYENYDFDTFELGGRVTTNEGILESFLTTNKQLNVNNLSTHYNEYDDEVLLRNYGTLIATRKGNDITINKTYFSKTTSTITNKLKNMALNKRINVNYVDKFADGGLINVKHSTRNYKDTDEEINVYEVDLGTLNVGNNHTTSHMITAIQESEMYDDLINELGNMISNSELVVKYKDNYGNNYRTDYDSSEFYDFVKRDSDDEYADGGGVSKLIVIENPYNEEGTFFEHTAKENISKIMNEVSFRKFGNEFRKHINPYFTQENNIERVNTGISWSELASYIIGDGDYSVNEEQYNNFIKAFNTTYNKKDDSTFAGGGEVEDWMEEALESLIEETGFDDLEITIVSDEGDEFYCSDGDAEYRVFKTEDDAQRVAIQQVREDLTETPESFNKDWLMNHIDGRSFFENELNEMNKQYAEDIKDESDDNYPNRLIAEMVDYGIIDSEDAFSMSADELANYYMNVFVTMLTEDALNQGNDGLDYFVSNFGEEDTYRMIIKNNLINLDDASEDAVNVDGIAHFLSTYDGETVYLDDNNVAYRVN